MTERDLAIVADEDVQPEERDRVDENVREPEEFEVGSEKRRESGDRREREQAADSPVREPSEQKATRPYFSVAAIRRVSSGVCSPASGVPGIRYLPIASGPISTGS